MAAGIYERIRHVHTPLNIKFLLGRHGGRKFLVKDLRIEKKIREGSGDP